MSHWSKSELAAMVASDDLHISPFREDGVTYGTPTWIWSVVIGNSLFVRAYNGQNSSWYKAAMQRKAGRIHVAGMEHEVSFRAVVGDINQQIDDAYRAKYKSSPYLEPMIGSRARTATVEIIPSRSENEALWSTED